MNGHQQNISTDSKFQIRHFRDMLRNKNKDQRLIHLQRKKMAKHKGFCHIQMTRIRREKLWDFLLTYRLEPAKRKVFSSLSSQSCKETLWMLVLKNFLKYIVIVLIKVVYWKLQLRFITKVRLLGWFVMSVLVSQRRCGTVMRLSLMVKCVRFLPF